MFGIHELIVLSMTTLLSSAITEGPVRQPPPPDTIHQIGVLAVLDSPDIKHGVIQRLFEPAAFTESDASAMDSSPEITLGCARHTEWLHGLAQVDGAFGRFHPLGSIDFPSHADQKPRTSRTMAELP